MRIRKGALLPDRLRILRVLSEKPMNVLEIAEALSLPASSVSNHINVLEEANLIKIQYQPAKKGHMKLCYKAVIEINILYLDKDFPETPHAQRGNAGRKLCRPPY